MRACQGSSSVFAVLALVWVAGADVFAAPPDVGAAAPALPPVPVTVSPWSQRPFVDVVLDTPELAACFDLMPGWWTAARPPAALVAPDGVGDVVGEQLAGVFGGSAPPAFAVTVAEGENAALAAVASGTTVLLMLPAGQPVNLQEAARAIIAATARAHSSPASPDPRCSEPLLAFAEAIASAGSLTLATLPPTLRPVADWLDRGDAAGPLAALAKDTLAGDEPWAMRRIRLQQTSLTSGASVTLLNAAARLVEAFGDVRRARRHPFDLLLAWRDDRDKRYPAMPGVLRHALAAPLTAGMPATSRGEDRAAIEQEARERAIESGEVAAVVAGDRTSLSLRLLAAAQARAKGLGSACEWLLAGPLPDSLRTGCREGAPLAAFVSARARAPGGFEIYAATAPSESLLLRWPGWVLFPLVAREAGLLVFADREGIWAVTLDSSAPPRRLASGEFRHLTLAADGKRIGAAHWPDGEVTVVSLTAETRTFPVKARHGLTWLDADLLLAADGEGGNVVSTRGETRPFTAVPPCATTLTHAGSSLLLGLAAPCEGGIVQLELAGGAGQQVLRRAGSLLGLVRLSDGSVIFGDAGGIWRWRAGESATRVGAGFTPGPG
jgi:hypothetical protein